MQEKCPYCGSLMEADFVDVGPGEVQCGPYHCYDCGASEIGPEYWDWCHKDREGHTLLLQDKRRYNPYMKKKYQFYSKIILRPGHPFTDLEIETGYYKGKISPYANTVGGELVNHLEAKQAYNVGLLDEKNIFEEE